MPAKEHSPDRPQGKAARLRSRGLAALLIAATILLALGLALPIVEVERLLVFEERTSLLRLVYELLVQGEVLLGGVVGIFSVAFPAFKIGLLLRLWLRPPQAASARRALAWIDRLGRWSMLDVLVVALVVFSVKASGWATAASQPALYCFAVAVLLTMAAASLTRRRLAAASAGEETLETG